MKQIALIAHDGKKAELVSFVLQNKDVMDQIKVVATGTTARHLKEAGFSVRAMLSGPMGGDAQIAALATNPASAALFLKSIND